MELKSELNSARDTSTGRRDSIPMGSTMDEMVTEGGTAKFELIKEIVTFPVPFVSTIVVLPLLKLNAFPSVLSISKSTMHVTSTSVCESKPDPPKVASAEILVY